MLITKNFIKDELSSSYALDFYKENKIINIEHEEAIEKLIKIKQISKAAHIMCMIMEKTDAVKFAIYSINILLPLYEKQYPNQNKPIETLNLIKKWLTNPNPAIKNKIKKNYEAIRQASNTGFDSPGISIVSTSILDIAASIINYEHQTEKNYINIKASDAVNNILYELKKYNKNKDINKLLKYGEMLTNRFYN